jgi:MFS family permease
MPSNTRLYLAAFVACLTAALFGYSVGFIGGVLVLPSFLHHFHFDSLSPQDLAVSQSRIVSVWLLGALFGVPLSMPICSRFGRKRCLEFSAALYVLGSAFQLIDIDGSVLVFEAGRLLNGLGVGAGTLASPM